MFAGFNVYNECNGLLSHFLEDWLIGKIGDIDTNTHTHT